MKVGRVLAALLTGLAVLPAQAANNTYLSGLVLDTSEAGIPGAMVTVWNEETGFRRVTWSRTNGGYVVASLEPGLYKITVRKEGFRTVVRFGFRLDGPKPASLNFTLPVGSTRETITVEGTAPPLEREGATLGAVATRSEIENLPLDGHNLLSLLRLSPGTLATPATRGEAGQFTTNGQRPNTNTFYVDGISVNTGVSGGGVPAQFTGGALPGLSAFGSMHGLISTEALDEFRIETATTRPESGHMPGATVLLNSRSGSNELHGSLFYGFRHEWLAANDWFANRAGQGRAPLRANDFGPALGGPIRRNRTFFFLAYEGLRLRQPFVWRTAVPSLATREQAPEALRPALNLYPEPNGSDLGAGLAEWNGRNTRPSGLDAVSLRIDHALTSHVTLFGRYSDTPSSNEFGSTQVNRLDVRLRSFTLGLDVHPAQSVTVDVRLNASSSRATSVWTHIPATPECYLSSVAGYFLRSSGPCDNLIRLSVSGLTPFVAGDEGMRVQRQFQVPAAVTFNRGSHALRFGLDYRRMVAVRRDAADHLNVIADTLNDLLERHNVWLAISPRESGSSILREISLSVQDTWQIGARWTATYGLRWELSPAPEPGKPVYFLDPVRNVVSLGIHPIWPDAYRNLAPRLGLAYRPGSSGGTVLRAGAGIYYNSSLSIATDLINQGPLNVSTHTSDISAPFPTTLGYGFLPDFRPPVTIQWSGSVEHAIRDSETVSAAYVGSVGRRLIRREMGGEASSGTFWMALATNRGSSAYHALELQYRRRLAQGLQARAGYTWSHSIDNSSSDALLHWTGERFPAALDRGSSDFDVRHAFYAAAIYEIARGPAWAKGWALDGIFHARSGFPITILDTENYVGLPFANILRPDSVKGVPLWVADSSAPGGRRLNRQAFRVAASGVQGSLGRNAITGFGMSQLDLALRREFSWHERTVLQLRVEAFNVFNRANFADPARVLLGPLFGESPSMLNLMLGTGSPGSGLAPVFQSGGPRSVQIVLRYRF